MSLPDLRARDICTRQAGAVSKAPSETTDNHRIVGRRRRRFRPDVEGLRAVAVLLVVLYHANVPRVTGGYVGVDVFFVISGFVITGVLLRERRVTGAICAGTETPFGWGCSWNTATVANGRYTLRIVATNQVGAHRESKPVAFTVKN